MIFFATYNTRKQAALQSKRLIFIEADERLTLEKVIALVRKLTKGDIEESSVEIIGQRAYDSKTIKNPPVKFHQVD